MNKQSKQVNQWNEAIEKVRTFMKNQSQSLVLKILLWKKKDIKNDDLEHQLHVLLKVQQWSAFTRKKHKSAGRDGAESWLFNKLLLHVEDTHTNTPLNSKISDLFQK